MQFNFLERKKILCHFPGKTGWVIKGYIYDMNVTRLTVLIFKSSFIQAFEDCKVSWEGLLKKVQQTVGTTVCTSVAEL